MSFKVDVMRILLPLMKRDKITLIYPEKSLKLSQFRTKNNVFYRKNSTEREKNLYLTKKRVSAKKNR